MKTTLVILVHGFNVSDGGKKTVGKLKYYFERHSGVTVRVLDYGYFGLLSTRLFNEEVSENLSKMIMEHFIMYDRIIVVGHSNGCAIAHMASEKLPESVYVDRYVYINPALKAELAPAGSVLAWDVWFNRKDHVVKLSKLLFWRASERPWGKMGAIGYQGSDPRVRQFDTGEGRVLALGHSTIFKEDKIRHFGPFIAQVALAGLPPGIPAEEPPAPDSED